MSPSDLQRELDGAIKRWADAKREQMLREDERGELIAAVRSAERDVEDAIHEQLGAELELRISGDAARSSEAQPGVNGAVESNTADKSGVEMGKVNRVELDFVQVRELDGKFLVELENPQEIERGRGLILFRCDSQYAAQELSRQVKGILNAYCKFRRCGYSWSGRIVCELSSWHQGEHWTSHDGGFSFSSAKAGSAETGGREGRP